MCLFSFSETLWIQRIEFMLNKNSFHMHDHSLDKQEWNGKINYLLEKPRIGVCMLEK